MVAVHTTRGMKRYRYYVSRPKMTGEGTAGSLHRISAGVMETFLEDQLGPRLASAWQPEAELSERVADALIAVTLSADQCAVSLKAAALDAEHRQSANADGVCSLALTFHMRRRQGAVILSATAQAEPPARNSIARSSGLWCWRGIGRRSSRRERSPRSRRSHIKTGFATTTPRTSCRWPTSPPT